MSTRAALHRRRSRHIAEALDKHLPPWGDWPARFETIDIETSKRAWYVINYSGGLSRVKEVLDGRPSHPHHNPTL